MSTTENQFLKNLPSMSDYDILRFEHVDDFRCFKPLSEFAETLDSPFASPSEEEAIALLAVLKHRITTAFTQRGWEGDGDINVVFVPPFLASAGGTHCTAIFHVKQSNNGTSFVAFPKGVKYGRPKDF